MKRRTFLTTGLAAGTSAAARRKSPASASIESGSATTTGPGPAKPPGRLARSYRIMWDQNHGQESFYNPPVDPEKVAQAHLGYFEGTPVDAYVCSLGPDCGYTVAYPTRVEGAEWLVDRLNRGARVGNVKLWRHAENLKRLWDQGIDPLQVQVQEARRQGIDFWFRLSMNDWHHADREGNVVRLIGSRFFSENPHLRIGEEGARGWPPRLARILAPLQDFAQPEVRRLRLDLMAESCQRYDVEGFLYDFMRVPGYFKFGQEEQNLPIMTDFIRESRARLDRIGEQRGRNLGLAVRVPNTIAGARRLGLDVASWVREDLVDLVIPSTFFMSDLEENVSEWAALTRDTPVRVHPALEEGYRAGHTGGVWRVFYDPPIMLPLTLDMIRALAARHWRYGADGLYVFNWFGTGAALNYDNRPALDDIADPLRLQHKNKRYAVTRTDHSFPNCLPHPRQIPVRIGRDRVEIVLDVADDLKTAGSRVKAVRLHLHLTNLTVVDRPEVRLNGRTLECTNPMQPAAYNPGLTAWQNYDVPAEAVQLGENRISLRLAEQNERLAEELPVELADLELAVEYAYPNGPWEPPPGAVPRT